MTQSERNKRILAAIKSGTRKLASSPELARNTLVSEGIYTAKGTLTAEYGGPAPRKAKRTA